MINHQSTEAAYYINYVFLLDNSDCRITIIPVQKASQKNAFSSLAVGRCLLLGSLLAEVDSSSRTSPLIEEEAHFRTHKCLEMNKNMVMGPNTKNDCDGKGQQQITALLYLLLWCKSSLSGTITEEDNLSTASLGHLV